MSFEIKIQEQPTVQRVVKHFGGHEVEFTYSHDLGGWSFQIDGGAPCVLYIFLNEAIDSAEAQCLAWDLDGVDSGVDLDCDEVGQ